MSTHDDNLLTPRFAALAPQPLPGDWHDVLGRAGPALKHGRRRLVVAFAVAALAVAVTAAAFGTARYFLDKGFIGLPPEGATPSAPPGAELVLKWNARSLSIANEGGAGGGAEVSTWVYADGRVIWERDGARTPEGATELRSGLLEQRLTPEGVELLRSEVVATGLFERNLALDVPQFDLTYGGAEIRRDDQLVHFEWGCPTAHSCEDATATPEQVSALRRLDALLSDPVSVLPSSAWADRRIRAYVPSHYAVCVDTSPPTDIAPLLSLLPARAEVLLRDQKWTRSEWDIVDAREGGVMVVLGRHVTYCSKLTTQKAREVDKALSGLDPNPNFPQDPLSYLVAEPVKNRDGVGLLPTTIGFQPYLPHQSGTAWDPGG